jgi:hypothetical protein
MPKIEDRGWRIEDRKSGGFSILHPQSSILKEIPVVRCEQGYLCDVCGQDVEQIIDSDLYLRYILGEVSPLALPNLAERHIRCNPAAAQYIVDAAFPPVRCEGIFAKDQLDPAFVAAEETRITRAWRRLQEIPALGIPITEYPLPEVIEAWSRGEA